ncbi:hypothetical protein ACFYNW_37625 [Streptomyces virginiae]|uniref:hypothetical protein n=1 Tax=Streptomyces virginiae TaxID=1961 RepID=UPI0036EEBC78
MNDEGVIIIDIRGPEKAAVEAAHRISSPASATFWCADVQRGPEAGGYASPETDVDSEPGPGHDYVAQG